MSGLLTAIIAVPAVALLVSKKSDNERAATADQVAAATTAVPTSAPDVRLQDTELVQQFGQSVYRVEVEGCEAIGSGTAFVIDEHHLMTAGHVVAFDPSPLLRGKDGTVLNGRVTGYSMDPDVAVIEVDESLAPVLSWADPGELTEGDHLLGLGYPAPASDFSAQPGTIVSFHSDGAGRPAVRTDAALDHGDSGGPALTDRGLVVGVITELAATDGVQIVPLVFTRDALGATVDDMLANPAAFSADCSSGWEPPVAPPYVYDDPPTYVPPAYTPPTYTVPSYTIPTYTIPTTTTLPCPTGAPTVEVTSVTVTQDDYFDDYWSVQVEGRVINNASATIYLSGVDVNIQASPPKSTYGLTNSYALRPGEASAWSADYSFLQSATEPTGATAELSYWSWSDYEYYDCGTG